MNTKQDPPLSGTSFIPIRAPLTIDSDSNYSRTNSFNSSTSSSIDISSFNDEHTNGHDNKNDDFDEIVLEQSKVEKYDSLRPFLTYPDGTNVGNSSGLDKGNVFRPFVTYPDGNCVKDCNEFDKGDIFRAFVEGPDEKNMKNSGENDTGDIFRTFAKNPDAKNVKTSGESDKGYIFRASVKYPDGDFAKESTNLDKDDVFRAFVKYPDGNDVKNSSGFNKGENFRAFVKHLCEESSSKLGVPVARLTSDGDSDVDSVDEVVERVDMVPKVRTFSGDEGDDDEVDDELQVEGVFSGDDISCISELNELVEDLRCKVDCLNEVVKISESDQMSFDLTRLDAQIVSDLGNEIGVESISGSEQEVMFDCRGNQSKKMVEEKEEEMVVMKVDMEPKVQIFGSDDITGVDELNDLMKGSVSAEWIDDEECQVGCSNEVMNLSEPDKMSKNVNESEQEDEMVVMKVAIAPEVQIFDSNEGDDDISDIDKLNGSLKVSVSTESIEDNRCKINYLNEPVKLSEPDESSFDFQNVDAQIVLDSGNRTVLETISGSEQEEALVKMQPKRSKFLKLVRSLGLLDKFDSHLTILAIGKTGVGKSATINSIFSEKKASTNAFDPGTTIIQEIVGNINGIQLKVFDTPGLKSSPFERSHNLRILKSIKRLARKHTPDVVLYVDRLDTHTRDNNDSHLLRLITSSLGSEVWRNCIIALTHATASPTDESLRGFVFQRCRFIQEQIHSHGSTYEHMVNPVCLVENHPCYEHDKSRFLEFTDYLGHNIVLDDGLSESEGQLCFDRANEDDCDQLPSTEPLRKQ